jgi:hypothetical protein
MELGSRNPATPCGYLEERAISSTASRGYFYGIGNQRLFDVVRQGIEEGMSRSGGEVFGHGLDSPVANDQP